LTLSPPASILLPYTTLFRSGVAGQAALRGGDGERAGGLAGDAERGHATRGGGGAEAGDGAGAGGLGEADDGRAVAGLEVAGRVTDRKSTRLNSSHQIISYAV